MRRAILTQKNNILLYTPISQVPGFAFPANEYVDIVVLYKDSFSKPIIRRRLIWRLVEGKAILRQPTTLTNGNGQGVNGVKVRIDDPDRQATVRLAVSSQDEPDSELLFECKFGASDTAPPLASENILKTIFPRNGTNSSDYIYSNSPTFHFLYSDQNGNIIPNKVITYSGSSAQKKINGSSNSAGNYLYIANNVPSSIYDTIVNLDISVDNQNSSSNYYSSSNLFPPMQINNFWPPSGSVLQPGVSYPLRALYTGGTGEPFPNDTICWSLTDGSPNAAIVSISPSNSVTDNNGVAVSTITCDYIPYGMSGDIKLDVTLDGYSGGGPLLMDYPTFIIGGERFTSITPSPEAKIPAVGFCLFTATLQYENNRPAVGVDIMWDTKVNGNYNVTFLKSKSITDDQGNTNNYLSINDIPQGLEIDATITITPPNGVPYTAVYTFDASIVKQHIPDPSDTQPLDVGTPVTIAVTLQDPDGNYLAGRTVYATCPSYIGAIVSQTGTATQITDSSGIASFQATIPTPSTPLFSFQEAVLQPLLLTNTTRTLLTLRFGDSGVTIYPPASGSMRYDTWISVSASVTAPDGTPMSGATLYWADGVAVVEYDTTTTDETGYSTNRICYETLRGFPAPPVTVVLFVQVENTWTFADQLLTFTASGLKNQLQLVSPPDGSQLPVGQPIQVTLRLTNQFGHPLANYDIIWEPPSDEAVVLNCDPRTDANGEAMAVIKGTIPGLAQFDASADLALAPCNFSFDFTDQPLPDYSVLLGSTYAHNPPTGENVDPSDNSQVVALTFRYLSNDIPQANKEVLWYINPRTPALRFFDAQNDEINIVSSGPIITSTDANGLSMLKIGSLTRYLGTISVAPKDDVNATAFQGSIVIATFDSGDINADLAPAIYTPNPIVIPDSFSTDNPGFQLSIPTPQSNENLQSIVFWIASGAPGETKQENIRVVTIQQAKQGITVPYSYTYPDPTPKGYNRISYMVVQNSTSASSLARSVTPIIKGNPMSNHPDYNNTNRTLPAPHLYNYANVVTGNNIIGGLQFFVPYSSNWVAGDTINLMIYLNGEDNMGGVIGNTLNYPQVITADDVTSKNDIAILVSQDQLSGYNDGTLESDYYIGAIWSSILENVTLDTAQWS
ncbi:Ig-like domain-containing protein [Brucella sp. 2716]|uniref:Ig-like domain-containing protein n=1 Tax=Brucella sp. 2716 TaxID=2975052 RepID=UPI00217CC240|nr:Ig-like domain-containing protein [Brucella sp. 2716]UWF60424.1 Ig-like domain-containing protein [Brucella sp. 2716]